MSTASQTGDYALLDNLKKENAFRAHRTSELEGQVRDLELALGMARQEAFHAAAQRDAADAEVEQVKLIRGVEEDAQQTAVEELQSALAAALRDKVGIVLVLATAVDIVNMTWCNSHFEAFEA